MDAQVIESYAVNYGTSFMDYREREVTADSADSLLAFYEADDRGQFVITRTWESACYTVSVRLASDWRAFVSWMIAL